MVYNFFDKKDSGGAVKIRIMLNQQLSENLCKPINKLIKTMKNEKYTHLL